MGRELPPATHRRVFGLDLMRTLAILPVMLCHTPRLLPERLLDDLPPYLWLGHLGVDIFFVLSGFLIGGILLKTFEREVNFGLVRNFWVRRWFRTLPNYVLALIVATMLAIYTPHLRPTWLDYVAHWLFLQNIAWPKSSFFAVSWSLAIEEWFYLLAPLLLLMVGVFRHGRCDRRAFLAVTIFMLVFPAVARFFSYPAVTDWYWGVKIVVVYRLDAIAYGVLGAYVLHHHAVWFHTRKWWCGMLGLGLLVPSMLLFIHGDAMQSGLGRAVILAMIPMSMLLLLPWIRAIPEPKRMWLSWPIYTTSVISYSLYLYHTFVFLFADHGLTKVLHGEESLSLSVMTIIAAWVCSFVFAWAVYRYFELPVTKLRNRFSRPEARVV